MSVFVTVPATSISPWAGIDAGVSVSMVTVRGVARAAARRAARREGEAARSPAAAVLRGPGAEEVRVVRLRRSRQEHRAGDRADDRGHEGSTKRQVADHAATVVRSPVVPGAS